MKFTKQGPKRRRHTRRDLRMRYRRLRDSDFAYSLEHLRQWQARNAPTIEEYLEAENEELLEAMELTRLEYEEMSDMLWEDFLEEQERIEEEMLEAERWVEDSLNDWMYDDDLWFYEPADHHYNEEGMYLP